MEGPRGYALFWQAVTVAGMNWIDLTLPTAAENIALDEACLELADRDENGVEVLRFWEPDSPAVILGRASHWAVEVDDEGCLQRAIPVVRRSSGGAAIVALPGCLMYAVVLSKRQRAGLDQLSAIHELVLDRVAHGVRLAGVPVERRGTSDLVWRDRKVSGNSLRCKRHAVLYHGTLLYNADLPLISSCLHEPPRQPDYRRHRPHAAFVANLPCPRHALVDGLKAAWQVSHEYAHWPQTATAELVEKRFGQAAWNRER